MGHINSFLYYSPSPTTPLCVWLFFFIHGISTGKMDILKLIFGNLETLRCDLRPKIPNQMVHFLTRLETINFLKTSMSTNLCVNRVNHTVVGPPYSNWPFKINC